jgi:hypothetical protein
VVGGGKDGSLPPRRAETMSALKNPSAALSTYPSVPAI